MAVIDVRHYGSIVARRATSVRAVPKKYREVRTALRAAGWEVLRQRGSHEVWGIPGESARIVQLR